MARLAKLLIPYSASLDLRPTAPKLSGRPTALCAPRICRCAAPAVLALMAVLVLQGCGSDSITDRLLSDDSKVRQETVGALQGSAMTEAVDALIVQLGDKRHADRAARALAEIGAPAVPALCRSVTGPLPPSSAETFKRDIQRRQRDAKARVKAIEVLGDTGSAEAVPALLHALSFAENPSFSYDYDILVEPATYALARIGRPALKPLLVAYYEEKSFKVCWAMDRALSMIADNIGHTVFFEEIWDPQTSGGAVDFLSSTGDKGAVDSLVALLQASGGRPRYDVAHALARIGGEKAQAAVAAFADRIDAPARARDYKVLLKKGDHESIDLLRFLFALYPTDQMAQDFGSSGNGRLKTDAMVWEDPRRK